MATLDMHCEEAFPLEGLHLEPHTDLTDGRNVSYLTVEVKDALANLFIAIAVADDEVMEVETTTLIEAFNDCFEMQTENASTFQFDFENRIKSVQNVLNSPGKRYWLGIQYLKLKAYPDHQKLLEKLWAIAVCDGRLDSRESGIIDLFARLWR